MCKTMLKNTPLNINPPLALTEIMPKKTPRASYVILQNYFQHQILFDILTEEFY